jgi:carboxylesterase type B
LARGAVNDGDIVLPTVDQDFLPDLSSSLLASGKSPKMPLIIGWEENDATLFTDPTIETSTDTKEFISLYYPDLASNTLSTLLSLEPSGDFRANIPAGRSAEFYCSAEIFRDILFVCPGFLFGNAMAEKYSNRHTTSGPGVDYNTPPVYYFANNQTIIANFLAAAGDQASEFLTAASSVISSLI